MYTKEDYLKAIFIKFPENKDRYDYSLLPNAFKSDDRINVRCIEHNHTSNVRAVFHKYRGNGICCKKCNDRIIVNILQSTKRMYTLEEMIELSKSIHGNDRFDYSNSEFTGMKGTFSYRCPLHGEIKVSTIYHLGKGRNGIPSGCPQCDTLSRMKKFYKRGLERNKKSGVTLLTPLEDIKNTMQLVDVECPVHGPYKKIFFDWYQKGQKCMACKRIADRIGTDNFISKARKVHGDFYDYSKVSLKLRTDKVTVTCPKHGEFIQKAGNHLSGSGCPKCSDLRNRKSREKFIADSKALLGDIYDYSLVEYINNKTNVKLICKKHGIFEVRPDSHLNHMSGCPKCIGSKGERCINWYLTKLGVEFIPQYKIEGYLFRYDFYLPKYNLLIEHQGMQHFEPVNLFGGINNFKITKSRDRKKKKIAKQNKYNLLYTTYVHLDNGTIYHRIRSRLEKLDKENNYGSH